MHHPLISIILCTYNGSSFLKEQIESLLAQTYPNIEIIISDDASTDNTQYILEQYRIYPGVRININIENVGFSKNFEIAARLSTGAFIAFSDQDDIWLPPKIEKLYASIGTHFLIYSDSKLIDEKGNDLNKNLSDFRNLQDIHNSKGFAFLNAVSGHTMMAKRELLEYAFPVPEGYFHDWWFAVQATNLSGVKYLNEKLTLYRQHSKTITKTVGEKKTSSRTFSKRYQQYIEELNWIGILKDNQLEKERSFYSELYDRYLLKNKNHFVWSLFWFLVKNQQDIFQFSKKKYLSKLFEIRKLARGEKEN